MEPTAEWSVYIARCADGSLYTGIAKDVRARLAAHNSGRGAAYTRPRRPLRLVYLEDGLTRSAALSREAGIKSLDRPRKLSLVKAARRALAAAVLLLAGIKAEAVPTFNKEDALVLSSATPQAFAGAYPSRRMYFIRAGSGIEVGSALSADGVTWAEESGAGRLSTQTTPSVSASSITGAGVLYTAASGYRMAYSIVSTTGNYRIHLATSADGLAWANSAVVPVDNGSTYLGSPKLVKLADDSWRIYYVGNVGSGLGNRRVFTTRSTNSGATWSSPTLVISTVAYEVGASALTNGLVRLYFSQPVSGASSATVVASALSSDSNGSSFSVESGFRLSTAAASGTLGSPVPDAATDTFRWRLYYDFFDPGIVSSGDIHSALTGPPAPVSISPSHVFNVQSTVSFTVSGDIFSSPAPTAYLSMSGQPNLLPSTLARDTDQQLTMTFNVVDQAVGLWDLTVTNADGLSATITGAVLVDFPGGSVGLVNNLLRPREGIPTTITITTFTSGHISSKIYSIDGRPVRTLYDNDQPKGILTLTWDGRSASGGTVASGVYLLRTLGPKIDVKSKIILIR